VPNVLTTDNRIMTAHQGQLATDPERNELTLRFCRELPAPE